MRCRPVMSKTGWVDDHADSPFGHVPPPSAGPRHLQDGPFTYEAMAQSAGRANLRHAPRWQAWTLGVLLGVMLASAGAVMFLLLLG
jgi:hypothetical protein